MSNACWTTRRLLSREAAERCGDAGGGRRVRDAHLAGQEAVVALRGDGVGELDACLDGLPRLPRRHGGALRHVARAGRDAVLAHEAGDALGICRDAHVDDEQVRARVCGEGIRRRALRDEVVRRHLHRRLWRVGADALRRDAVVSAADDRTFFQLRGIGLARGAEVPQHERVERARVLFREKFVQCRRGFHGGGMIRRLDAGDRIFKQAHARASFPRRMIWSMSFTFIVAFPRSSRDVRGRIDRYPLMKHPLMIEIRDMSRIPADTSP